MNLFESHLNKLSEECLEVAQRCSKALRFGALEIQSEQPLNNLERIQEEMAGLLSAYRILMRDHNLQWPTDEQCNKAYVKYMKYLELSRENGTLQ